MILPEASLPMLDPRAEMVTYQANTSALVDGVVNWDKTDLYGVLNTVCVRVT
jgi:hypothetical protein